jgi:hypothetical protein
MPVKAPVRKITEMDWNPMNSTCLRTRENLKGGVTLKEKAFTRKIPMFPVLRIPLNPNAPSRLTKSILILDFLPRANITPR